MDDKFCKNCGKQITEVSAYCSSCGNPINGNSNSNQPTIIINNNQNHGSNNHNNIPYVKSKGKEKSKWIALLLCFFFGVFGVHRFYEGKIGTGLLWLFTGGLLGIGVIIDLFVILFRPDPYYV